MSKSRESYLKRTYGITLSQYNQLLKKQKDSCAVCGKHKLKEKRSLSVDHDHKTREIRGLLCNFCNHRVVGHHRDSALLSMAGVYLTGPFSGWFAPVKKRRRRRRR